MIKNSIKIQKFNIDQLEINKEKFTDPDEFDIFFPDNEEGVFSWKRPSQYIHQYLIRNEIITNYPLGNLTKINKFVYEMYYENSSPLNDYININPNQERKSLKKGN